MHLLEDIHALQLDGCALTIGSFDGVHLGHQSLIRAMIESARRHRLDAVMISFFPHPAVVLGRRQPPSYLTSSTEKANLVKALGVTHLVTHPFDRHLSKLSADEFLTLLREHTSLRHLWIGENFALGYRREGNRFYLDKVSGRFGFEVHVQAPLRVGGEVVSSSRIREALRSGDVSRATGYLGRRYVIPGKLIPGPGLNPRFGIPTSVVSFWNERAIPGEGVYACKLDPGHGSLDAMAIITESRPQDVPEGRGTLEVHTLGGAPLPAEGEVRLAFVECIRGERDFPDAAAARRQFERDAGRATVILQRAKED